MWQQPNREYISTYLEVHGGRRAGARSSLSSRAGLGLDFFTPLNCAEMLWQVIRVVQCTFIVVLDVGPVGCIVPEMPVLIFNQKPTTQLPITERGPSLLEALCSAYWAIRRARYELTDQTTLL